MSVPARRDSRVSVTRGSSTAVPRERDLSSVSQIGALHSTKAAIAAVQEQTEISPDSGASRKRRGNAQGFLGVFAAPGSCSGQSPLGSPGCRGENRVAVTLHRPWQMAAR